MLSQQITVQTTVTLLVDGTLGTAGIPQASIIKNLTGAAATIYVGDVNVTTSNGFPILAGESASFDLVGQKLYGVVASTTVTAYLITRF